MKRETVRAIIALTVVVVFMAITAFMAIFPLVSPTNVQLTEYSDFFAKMASVYTGILGVIVGYYFARAEERKVSLSDQSKSPPSDPNSAIDSTGEMPLT